MMYHITIRNAAGPGYLIPIPGFRNACLNPGGLQYPGWYTCYAVVTDLIPELDCIFVAERLADVNGLVH